MVLVLFQAQEFMGHHRWLLLVASDRDITIIYSHFLFPYACIR